MEQFLNHFIYNLKSKLNEILLYEKSLILIIILSIISVTVYEFGKRNISHIKYNQHSKVIKKQYIQINYFTKWRDNFISVATPIDQNGLVRGFFLGKDEYIPEKIREDFKNAGLYHLLAASGFNCFIVSFCFLLFSRLILHLSWFRLSNINTIKLKSFISPMFSILGAWIFFFWSDQSPPIVRASIMITVNYLLNYLGIFPKFSRTLLVHYFIFIIFSPWLFNSASFQLTFGCLLGIIIFEKISPIYFFLNKSNNSIVHSIIKTINTSLGACLGTVPTTWIFFGSINFTSIFTNFFAVPITSFLIMPFSICSMIAVVPISDNLLQFQIFLAKVFITISYLLSELLNNLVHVYNKHGILLLYQN